jgi:hypothetical protein
VVGVTERGKEREGPFCSFFFRAHACESHIQNARPKYFAMGTKNCSPHNCSSNTVPDVTPKYDTCSSKSNPCPNTRMTSLSNEDPCVSECSYPNPGNYYDCLATCALSSTGLSEANHMDDVLSSNISEANNINDVWYRARINARLKESPPSTGY